MTEPVLAVHGGAGSRPPRPEARAALEQGLREALGAGQRILADGGAALDAVVAAVVVLEDHPRFNAGRGAVLCADGSVELSASVMEGRTRAAGAVALVRELRNPVSAARALLAHRHVMLAGEAADRFGREAGLEYVENAHFVTPERTRQWQRRREGGGGFLDSDVRGTVGAVARDRQGHLAAATSTGGLLGQLPGRVGDTPGIGHATWADDRSCAVSGTGDGEAFVRAAFARRVADQLELAGVSLEEACARALEDVRAAGGLGGCIAVDTKGHVTLSHNSPHLTGTFV